jgi:hypothetical protein
VRPGGNVEVVLDYADVYDSGTGLGVDLVDAVKVPGHVQDKSMSDCLACETGSRSAGNDGHVQFACRYHGGRYIVRVPWESNTDGRDGVHACVAAKQVAAVFVERDFSI